MNPRYTEHLLTLSVERAGKWFHLARYHDHDYADRGPEALSRFLGLEIYDVFAIAYDFRGYVEGDLTALVGAIPAGNHGKSFRGPKSSLWQSRRSNGWIAQPGRSLMGRIAELPQRDSCPIFIPECQSLTRRAVSGLLQPNNYR